jgi:hypothetical protein
MKIRVDSVEYKAWHEVGHATVCLHLGGEVELIEFLYDDARGHARASCIVTPEIEKTVACAGFAAEFYLLKNGLAELAHDDERDINQIVFHNATSDREDFWGRKLCIGEAFSASEDEEFMRQAIDNVVPLFCQYLSGMNKLVRELCDERRVLGMRVKTLIRS